MRRWVSSKLAIVKDLGQIQSGVDSVAPFIVAQVTGAIAAARLCGWLFAPEADDR
jgi:glycerol uptake facilitator-like aquaporin